MQQNDDFDKFDRFAKGTVAVTLLVILGLVVLFGWGFIELVQWITSK